MTDDRPRRVEGLEIEEAGDGFIVYQPDRDRIHYLNATAAVLFELATGELDPTQMAATLARLYSLAAPPHDDVRSGLEHLAREGLIEWIAPG